MPIKLYSETMKCEFPVIFHAMKYHFSFDFFPSNHLEIQTPFLACRSRGNSGMLDLARTAAGSYAIVHPLPTSRSLSPPFQDKRN